MNVPNIITVKAKNRMKGHRMSLDFTLQLFRYSELFLFLLLLQGSPHPPPLQALMVKLEMISSQISFHGWLFASILGLTAFVAMRFLYYFHAALLRIHAGFCHLHSSISGQNKYSELGVWAEPLCSYNSQRKMCNLNFQCRWEAWNDGTQLRETLLMV